MSFDDHAVLCATEDRTLSTFGSAASALRLLSRRRDIRLVWVDDEA